MKITIDEYAKKFKMSKEMVYSKVKDKKLNCIEENDTKYIILQDESKKEVIQQPKTAKKPTVGMIISLYQKENKLLKDKVAYLEAKVEQLVSDKEKMLIEERDKIEAIYTEKDTQIRQALELISSHLIQNSDNNLSGVHDVETYEIEDRSQDNDSELVDLKKYLKSLNISSSEKKAIKQKFLKAYNDVRVIKKNDRLYLNFSKYDYSDLLKA